MSTFPGCEEARTRRPAHRDDLREGVPFLLTLQLRQSGASGGRGTDRFGALKFRRLVCPDGRPLVADQHVMRHEVFQG
jgi:hypothetical protein